MANRRIILRSACATATCLILIAVVGIGLVGCKTATEQASIEEQTLIAGSIPNKDFHELLLRWDSEFFSSFKIKIEASIPHIWGQSGHYIAELELTGKTDEQFLKQNTVDLSKLTYSPPTKYDTIRGGGGSVTIYSGGRDFDESRNLLVQQHKDQYIMLDGDKVTQRSDFQEIAVNSEGKVEYYTQKHPIITKYPESNPDGRNLYYRFVLPLGRGYSRLISQIDKITPGPGGLVTVEACGRSFSPYTGKWVLEVDTENQYLVRKAVFTRDGSNKLSLVCESQGCYDSDVALSRKGTFNLGGDYKISVSLIDYTRIFNEAIKAEVVKKVNATSLEAMILDYNSVNDKGAPLRIDKPLPKELLSPEPIIEPEETKTGQPIEAKKED